MEDVIYCSLKVATWFTFSHNSMHRGVSAVEQRPSITQQQAVIGNGSIIAGFLTVQLSSDNLSSCPPITVDQRHYLMEERTRHEDWGTYETRAAAEATSRTPATWTTCPGLIHGQQCGHLRQKVFLRSRPHYSKRVPFLRNAICSVTRECATRSTFHVFDLFRTRAVWMGVCSGRILNEPKTAIHRP